MFVLIQLEVVQVTFKHHYLDSRVCCRLTGYQVYRNKYPNFRSFTEPCCGNSKFVIKGKTSLVL